MHLVVHRVVPKTLVDRAINLRDGIRHSRTVVPTLASKSSCNCKDENAEGRTQGFAKSLIAVRPKN